MAARHLQSQMRDKAHAGREPAVSSQSKGDGRQRTTHSAALSHLCSLHWVQSRSMTSGVFLVFYV